MTFQAARARIFGGGDRIWKALACICACSSVWEESGRETIKAWPDLAFTSLLSGYGRSMTLLRTKKPTTAFVFWPRLEIHVGSGPD